MYIVHSQCLKLIPRDPNAIESLRRPKNEPDLVFVRPSPMTTVSPEAMPKHSEVLQAANGVLKCVVRERER